MPSQRTSGEERAITREGERCQGHRETEAYGGNPRENAETETWWETRDSPRHLETKPGRGGGGERQRHREKTWGDGGAQPGMRKVSRKRPDPRARPARRGPAESDPDRARPTEEKHDGSGTEPESAVPRGPGLGGTKPAAATATGGAARAAETRTSGGEPAKRTQRTRWAPGVESQAGSQEQRPRAETSRARGGRTEAGERPRAARRSPKKGSAQSPGSGSEKGCDGGRGPLGAHLAAPASSSAPRPARAEPRTSRPRRRRRR